MEQIKRFPGISGSTLKLIALVSMLIDHTGATVIRSIQALPAIHNVPERAKLWAEIYRLSRSIGRIAFPIFCFLLVEGFFHTRNQWKYALRLFLFALLSEIPFDIALKGNWYFPQKQNVYFTLLIGLLVMIAIHSFMNYFGEWPLWPNDYSGNWPDVFHLPVWSESTDGGPSFSGILCTPLFPVLIRLGMCLAKWLDTDYNYKGVFLIVVFYLMKKYRILQCIFGGLSVSWEYPAPLAAIPILFYNGKRGLKLKYLFYWFYPVHLLLLYAICTWILPLFA